MKALAVLNIIGAAVGIVGAVVEIAIKAAPEIISAIQSMKADKCTAAVAK